MQYSEWIFAFAAVIGKGHIQEGLPCQDYCDVNEYDNFSIAVVADGAGSCANSQIGSKKVSELALDHFAGAIKQNGWADSNLLPTLEDWSAQAKQLLLQVRNDLYIFSENDKIDFKSLSCTIIVTIALKNGLLVTHIGDGRAGYCTKENNWLHMISPYHGEEANETVFITSDIWEPAIIDKYIECAVIDEAVKAFCLLSDGCEKAAFECNLFDEQENVFYDPNKPFKEFYDKNIHVHLPHLRNQGKSQEEINALWRNFLENGNETLRNETDDKSMILAVKTNPVEVFTDVAAGTT